MAPTGSSTDDELLRQVGKTVMGTPICSTQVDSIVDTIVAVLDITATDVVADLGCGNGLLTARVAPHCNRIIGVDVAPSLIDTARSTSSGPSVSYHVGDLVALDLTPLAEVNRAYSYEVLQHLSTAETYVMLHQLGDLFAAGLRLYLGSIPDAERLRAFYDTPQRWEHYLTRLAENTEQIGHWWRQDELTDVCEAAGLQCRIHTQRPSLYTAHYRFDVEIWAR